MVDQYTFHEMTFSWLDGPMLNTDGGTCWIVLRHYGDAITYNELDQMPQLSSILVQYQE